MKNIIGFIDYIFALFNRKPLLRKDDYYLYVRIYYKKGRIVDFLSYPVAIAESGLREGLIKKIRPLTDKERAEAIRKEYKK